MASPKDTALVIRIIISSIVFLNGIAIQTSIYNFAVRLNNALYKIYFAVRLNKQLLHKIFAVRLSLYYYSIVFSQAQSCHDNYRFLPGRGSVPLYLLPGQVYCSNYTKKCRFLKTDTHDQTDIPRYCAIPLIRKIVRFFFCYKQTENLICSARVCRRWNRCSH